MYARKLPSRQHPGVFTSFEGVLDAGLPTQAPWQWEHCSKPSGAKLDGSHVPFGSTATHEPAGLEILRVEVEVPGCGYEQEQNDWNEHPGTNGNKTCDFY